MEGIASMAFFSGKKSKTVKFFGMTIFRTFSQAIGLDLLRNGKECGLRFTARDSILLGLFLAFCLFHNVIA